ncbi:MAG: alpha/beta fold hydrolase, partial [Chloroflexi bacterium]|nr:alpha/beta fold hydrolase [Chloroflexota bacterium]
FGQTESPEGEYSMELFAEDLYQLLRALGIGQSYVLGYSMGGRIALELTLRHSNVVKALVLANSGVGGARTAEGQGRLQGILELLEKGDMATLTEDLTVMAFSPGFKEKNTKEFERYKAVKLENDPKGFARVMRAMMASPPPSDPSRIKCPTLIIAGEYEGPVERAKASQEAIPGSQLRILPTGHGSAVEAPQAFNNTLLEFLASISR